MAKYTNTNTQIHKYTNTVWTESEDRHDICYIFEKLMLRGCQNQCLEGSHMKIPKYKNTQIHKYTNTVWTESEDRHDMCYIFEKLMLRGCQNQCLQGSHMKIHKYTNTQIHKYTVLTPCTSKNE